MMIAETGGLSIADLFLSISWEQVLHEITMKKIYIEALRKYLPFCAVAIFWIGCNVGSFLNVCIYRLPLGMSLLHPRSHCPKCGHKLSFFENIPLFSYIFLCGSCRSCAEPISPRYITVETLTGLLFTAVYLKVVWLNLPLFHLLLYFFLICIAVTAAFTDCDLRVIPNTVTLPGLVLVPAFWLLHLMPSLNVLDWAGFTRSLIFMAGVGGGLAAFALLGKLLFKKEAFGWGDVKYMAVMAGGIGWFASILVLAGASIAATVYMPIYWLFRPKRKHRGFAFAPFLTIFVLAWLLFGDLFLKIMVCVFRND